MKVLTQGCGKQSPPPRPRPRCVGTPTHTIMTRNAKYIVVISTFSFPSWRRSESVEHVEAFSLGSEEHKRGVSGAFCQIGHCDLLFLGKPLLRLRLDKCVAKCVDMRRSSSASRSPPDTDRMPCPPPPSPARPTVALLDFLLRLFSPRWSPRSGPD